MYTYIYIYICQCANRFIYWNNLIYLFILSMYNHIYICLLTYTYEHIWNKMGKNDQHIRRLYTHIQTRKYTYIYIYTYVHMFWYVRFYVPSFNYMYIQIGKYTHIHTHTYIYIYINAYTYAPQTVHIGLNTYNHTYIYLRISINILETQWGRWIRTFGSGCVFSLGSIPP